MYPTLFHIFGFSISTYGVIVALAALVALKVAERQFISHGLDPEGARSIAFYALIGGFIGAKIYFVLLNGGPILSRGGFVWYGGLIGGTIGGLLSVRQLHLPLFRATDAFAPAIAIGHAIGHVACFFSGDSYGVPSNLPWAVAFPNGAPPSTAGALRNVFGVQVPASIPDNALVAVHPTMLYSALALLLIYLYLHRRSKSPSATGFLTGLYLIAAGTERFLVEFVRAKDDRLIFGYTTAQLIASLAVIAGLAVVWRIKWRSKRVLDPGGTVKVLDPNHP